MRDDDDEDLDQVEALTRAEMPEMLERVRRGKVAIQEPGVSGQLRRAVKASGLRYGELSRQTGLTLEEIDDFMIGATVPPAVVDALADAVKYHLVPVE